MSNIKDAYTIKDYKDIINKNIQKNLHKYTIPGVSFQSDSSQIPLMITGFNTINGSSPDHTNAIEIVALETEVVDANSKEDLNAITQETLFKLFAKHSLDENSLIMIKLPESIDPSLTRDSGTILVDKKEVTLATPQKLKLLTPQDTVSQESPLLAFIEI